VARALLTRPQLLLMDEPLSALDLKRKQEILPYLERLHEELAIPVVYVSHAPDEVARLADHLVLLERGRVVASGPLQQTLARTDLPPAFADDAGVVIAGQLQAQEPDGLMRLAFAGGVLLVPTRAYPVGHGLRCRIHARDVSLSLQEPHCSSILNRLPAVVEAVSEGRRPVTCWYGSVVARRRYWRALPSGHDASWRLSRAWRYGCKSRGWRCWMVEAASRAGRPDAAGVSNQQRVLTDGDGDDIGQCQQGQHTRQQFLMTGTATLDGDGAEQYVDDQTTHFGGQHSTVDERVTAGHGCQDNGTGQ